MAQAFGEELVHSKQLEEAWSMEVYSTAAKLSLSKMLKVSDLIQSSQIFSKSLTTNTRIVTIIQKFQWLK